MDQALEVAIALLQNIAVVILVAAGLALVFGFMGVINFAQGQFIMIGAYVLLEVHVAGLGELVAIPVAFLVTAVIGVIVYGLLIRPLRGRLLETILATWGLGLVLTQAITIIFGPVSTDIPAPLGAFQVGHYSIAWYNLVIIGGAVAVMVGLYVLFTRSRFGLKANASIQIPEMASALGIRTERTNMLTFALGCGLAGGAGALLAPMYSITPQLGDLFTATSFLSVVVGGPLAVTGLSAAGGLLGGLEGIAGLVWNSLVGQVVLLGAAIVLLRVFGNGLSASWRGKI